MTKCKEGYIRSGKGCVRKGMETFESHSERYNYRAPGIGFAGLLTLLFIGLKLGKVINWSWFWVLSPIWISILVGIGFVLIFIIIGWFVLR